MKQLTTKDKTSLMGALKRANNLRRNKENNMFFLTCSKCDMSVKITDESIREMQAGYRDMAMGEAGVSRKHPINIEFGSTGGCGVLSIQCTCGNDVDGQK